MKKNEQKLFTDSGIDTRDGPAVLSLILAAPQAVADTIGLDGAIRVEEEVCSRSVDGYES